MVSGKGVGDKNPVTVSDIFTAIWDLVGSFLLTQVENRYLITLFIKLQGQGRRKSRKSVVAEGVRGNLESMQYFFYFSLHFDRIWMSQEPV